MIYIFNEVTLSLLFLVASSFFFIVLIDPFKTGGKGGLETKLGRKMLASFSRDDFDVREWINKVQHF
jgi:hypothetical protein